MWISRKDYEALTKRLSDAEYSLAKVTSEVQSIQTGLQRQKPSVDVADFNTAKQELGSLRSRFDLLREDYRRRADPLDSTIWMKSTEGHSRVSVQPIGRVIRAIVDHLNIRVQPASTTDEQLVFGKKAK